MRGVRATELREGDTVLIDEQPVLLGRVTWHPTYGPAPVTEVRAEVEPFGVQTWAPDAKLWRVDPAPDPA